MEAPHVLSRDTVPPPPPAPARPLSSPVLSGRLCGTHVLPGLLCELVYGGGQLGVLATVPAVGPDADRSHQQHHHQVTHVGQRVQAHQTQHLR